MKNRCSLCGKTFKNKLFVFSVYGRKYHPTCWFIMQERFEKFIDILCSRDEEFEKWLKDDAEHSGEINRGS